MTDSQPDAKERLIDLGETLEAHVRATATPMPMTVGTFALNASLGHVNDRILADLDAGVLDPNYAGAFLDYLATSFPLHAFDFPSGPHDTIEVVALADVLENVIEDMLGHAPVNRDVPARELALVQARAIASIGGDR